MWRRHRERRYWRGYRGYSRLRPLVGFSLSNPRKSWTEYLDERNRMDSGIADNNVSDETEGTRRGFQSSPKSAHPWCIRLLYPWTTYINNTNSLISLLTFLSLPNSNLSLRIMHIPWWTHFQIWTADSIAQMVFFPIEVRPLPLSIYCWQQVVDRDLSTCQWYVLVSSFYSVMTFFFSLFVSFCFVLFFTILPKGTQTEMNSWLAATVVNVYVYVYVYV